MSIFTRSNRTGNYKGSFLENQAVGINQSYCMGRAGPQVDFVKLDRVLFIAFVLPKHSAVYIFTQKLLAKIDLHIL